MTARLFVAPAGHGKTQFAIDRIRAIKASEPLAPVTVILPNQIRVAEFRNRLAASGGALGIGLVTFHALYAELLTRIGEPKARLSDPVQVRLLRGVVDRLCDEGGIKHYAPLRGKPGFVTALRDAIEELKRARVQPDLFFSAVMGLGLRLEELAAIYGAYQDWLLREDWVDAEGQGWLAALALERHPELGREMRLLVVNGFDEFNPTQMGVLTVLARRARETIITLTGDTARPRLAHRRFLRAQQTLAANLDLKPGPLEYAAENRPSSAELALLEANLFETHQNQTSNSKSQTPNHQLPITNYQSPTSNLQSPISNIQFLEAQNRSEEARAALRWIKTRVVRDGVPLSETAILSRNLDPYRPFLEEVAAEFGVPLRMAGGLPLIDNPAVAALLSLLSLPVLDWPRRQALEAWRSPYFDWSEQGIIPGDAAVLDAVSRAGRVIAGLSRWREAFDVLARQKLSDPAMDDEDAAAAPLPPRVASRVGEKFDVFVEALTPPARATIREYAAFVEDLIGDEMRFSHFSEGGQGMKAGVGIVARALDHPATAARDIAALRAFKDVLRGLVLAEATLGAPDAIDYPAFYEELRGAVEAATYSALSHDMGEPLPLRFRGASHEPGVEAGVLVASVLDARGLSFRAVALLGLSEGEFPQTEREDILLRESDRAVLRERGVPIEPKLRGDEVTFFYQAATRARERLLLCRPYLAEDGQPWEPSPYWLQAWHLLGQPPVHKVRPEDALPPEEAASPLEFIQSAGQLDPHLERGIDVLHARLSTLSPAGESGSAYEGQLAEIASSLAERYASVHGWSASRLETYGMCPFSFYVSHVLALEPRTPPEEGYDTRILGAMLHKILEDTYRQAGDPADLDACLRALPDASKAVFDTAPADYGFRPTPLWDAQRQELERILRETIAALAEVSEGYTPRHFEQRFGLGQPSLLLQTGEGEIRLQGYIDRLDVGPDGRLRVIDYKSSGSPIGPKHLEEGRRLQLPLYALAARDALGLGEIESGFYWHIARAERSRLRLETYEGGVEASFQVAAQHVAAHVRNIRAGHFQPSPPPEGCPSYCPAIGFCWRYTPRPY
jgi:ATP-dependent helicase/DNAse subunit B